jgi:hypothetical protein
VTEGWRKCHVELHNLYSSPNIITMIKLSANTIHRRCQNYVHNFSIIKSEKRGFLENLGIDGRIILKSILEFESMDWNHLAQYRFQLQSLVSMAMGLLVTKKVGDFFLVSE